MPLASPVVALSFATPTLAVSRNVFSIPLYINPNYSTHNYKPMGQDLVINLDAFINKTSSGLGVSPPSEDALQARRT